MGAVLSAWGPALAARAQSCHAPSLREHGEARFRVSLSSVYATYETPQYAGEYQGLRVLAAYMDKWIYVHASLPGYRLVRNGSTDYGLGDVGADVRVTAYRSEDGKLSLGGELAAMFPSGSAAKDLGMGHVMLMPGAWARLEQDKLSFWVQLAYGRSIGGSSHHHHHHHEAQAAGPIVNPMNRSELEHALGVAYAVHPAVRLTGRALGAVPIAANDGQARQVLAPGLSLLFGPIDVSLELEWAVVGQPFTLRTQLGVGAQW
jgi:hypothetical protein